MTAAAVSEQDIAGLFPAPVQACIAGPEMEAFGLTEEEGACVARAVPARRREFILGRVALKQALARIGAAVSSIPTLPDRSPRLPPGYVASLTHCEGLCAAVAARAEDVAALGFDAEQAEPLPAEFEALICGPRDGAAGTGKLSRPDPLWLTVLFSAKEAVYKCQHRIASVNPDFSDVSLVFHADDSSDRGRFDAIFGGDVGAALASWRFQGAWRVQGGLVLSAAWAERMPGSALSVKSFEQAPH